MLPQDEAHLTVSFLPRGNPSLTLNTCRSSLRESAHLLDGCHGRVARKCRHQGTVCPSEFHGLLRRRIGEQAEKESGGEAISTSDAVVNIEFCRGSGIRFAVYPGHRTPTVTASRVHFAQRGGNYFDLRIHSHDSINHPQENA